MIRSDALALEEHLQEAIKQDQRHTLFRKYCPERRLGPYYRSAGARYAPDEELVHSVYIAWFEQGYQR